MKKILFIFGTRPEAIKLAPLIIRMKKEIGCFSVKVCVTAQHREMLDQVLGFFMIKPDFDLNLMAGNQSLSYLTTHIIEKLDTVLDEVQPDIVIVQGDTTSALAGALAASYRKIEIAYIEDGLRSDDKFSPFPEEINRRMLSQLADHHFAPTNQAVENLKDENIRENIYQVGNTAVDALLLGLDLIKNNGDDSEYSKFFRYLKFDKKLVLVTCHRRESFGRPLENICLALKKIAKITNVEIVFPVHLNPNILKTVHGTLEGIDNIHLVKPLDYPHLLWLMSKTYMIITDSGGIQEEAPSFKKPILVTRKVTERMEGIKAGTAVLVGDNVKVIVREAKALIINGNKYKAMVSKTNPYGDGRSCEYIVKILMSI